MLLILNWDILRGSKLFGIWSFVIEIGPIWISNTDRSHRLYPPLFLDQTALSSQNCTWLSKCRYWCWRRRRFRPSFVISWVPWAFSSITRHDTRPYSCGQGCILYTRRPSQGSVDFAAFHRKLSTSPLVCSPFWAFVLVLASDFFILVGPRLCNPLNRPFFLGLVYPVKDSANIPLTSCVICWPGTTTWKFAEAKRCLDAQCDRGGRLRVAVWRRPSWRAKILAVLFKAFSRQTKCP